jgi:hypothetical protein
MLDTIKIRRVELAPRPAKRTGRSSRWRALFNDMKVGDWFVVDKKHYSKVGNAGQLYLRGKYSLYKHPETEGQYIFVRTK